MSDEAVIIFSIVGAAACYQAFVSFLVVKCRFIEPRARRIQLLLIWIVPLLGALICHAVVRSHGPSSPTNDSMVRHYEEVDEYGWPKSARRYNNQRIDNPVEGEGDE